MPISEQEAEQIRRNLTSVRGDLAQIAQQTRDNAQELRRMGATINQALARLRAVQAVEGATTQEIQEIVEQIAAVNSAITDIASRGRGRNR